MRYSEADGSKWASPNSLFELASLDSKAKKLSPHY